MNSSASFLSRYFSHLFTLAIICAAGGFPVSIAAASFGFPVTAQISFDIGLIGLLALAIIGFTGLVGFTVQRLWQLAR